MRLITHNMLMCHAKGCGAPGGFPLKIEEAELQEIDADYNEVFLRRILTRIDWPALVETAFSLGVDQLPAVPPESPDDALLRRVHHILLETMVKEGRMVCNGCGHIYPIRDGIPNMLLQETEV
ncbi:hypothetical protein DFJ73DRAFT_836381 [Zopfochytrium polystomum]|nr:hypothetical protein DFJ73DRAFT_836381 [Zopfochytrium polystomum]